MKIFLRILLALGLTCLGVGILLICVSTLTGGGLDSVLNHQILTPYLELVQGQWNAVLGLFAQLQG